MQAATERPQAGTTRQRPEEAKRAPEVLARVAKLASRLPDVDEAVVLLLDPARSPALVAAARAGRREPAARVAWGTADGAVGRALATGLPAADGGRDSRLSAAAPITAFGRTRGVVAVSAAAAGRRFDRDQLEMLADLGAIASASLEERERRVEAESAVEAGVEVLARAVDVRDDYTGRHSTHVDSLARRTGERLGMTDADIELLGCAARLHDVGKLGVPDAILQKPGPLDEQEWAVMRRHPDVGADMVSGVPGLRHLAALVRAHHERWDGGGYPQGLAGEGIPLASRVISVCDAFEAMISQRPYRPPLTVEAALAELTAGAGSQFDPAVVAAVQQETSAAVVPLP